MNLFRKTIAIFLLCITLMSCVSVSLYATAQGVGTYVVDVDVLNMRASASTDSGVIGKLYANQKVTVTEVNGTWGKISHNGKTGWISLEYASFVSAPAVNSEEYIVNVDVLNVRASANTTSSIIAKLYKGQKVNVTEINGTWGKITVNGTSGWISLEYASKSDSDTPSSTPDNGNPTVTNTKIGADGIALIKKMEGFRATKYWDYGHYSIGYGSTCGANEYPNGITEEQATRLLLEDLKESEVNLDTFLNSNNIKVSAKQYDSLVSFTFNLGNPWVRFDSFMLKDILIDGASEYKPDAIRNAFLQFKKAGGEVLSGLVIRRNLEADMFIAGTAPLGRPFSDVTSYFWYYTPVNYCYNKGVMSGVSDTKYIFSPNSSLTRAQMVTMLAKLSDMDPAYYNKSSFNDVKVGAWYAPYIQWAYQYGIVSGTGNGNFSPNAPLSRQDMAVMFYNFTKAIGRSVAVSNNNAYTAFTDHTSVASYAKQAVNWAVSVKLISGNYGKLEPALISKRCQVAQVAYMYMQNVLGYK